MKKRVFTLLAVVALVVASFFAYVSAGGSEPSGSAGIGGSSSLELTP